MRIPRTDTSRIEPLNHDAFVGLPLLLERGEGWGEESTSFEGFMERIVVAPLSSNCDVNRRPLTLTLSPRRGEGIRWRRAEFIGFMPRRVRRSDSPYVGGYDSGTSSI